MNDHTFEQREIIDMYRDWKKWKKGKDLFSEIKEGEWAECVIQNIPAGRIHTINSPYDEEILEHLKIGFVRKDIYFPICSFVWI